MGWPIGWALLGLAAIVSGAGAGEAKISPRLGQELSRGDASRVEIVWVYFADKGASAASRPATPISARALSRRARRGRVAGASAEDRPLVPAYTEAVARNVRRVRHQLRWLNAVSVEATAEQVRALESCRSSPVSISCSAGPDPLCLRPRPSQRADRPRDHTG